jgi:hypothetical protein
VRQVPIRILTGSKRTRRDALRNRPVQPSSAQMDDGRVAVGSGELLAVDVDEKQGNRSDQDRNARGPEEDRAN